MGLRDFEQRVPEYHARIDAALEQWLPPADSEPKLLRQAMRYSAMGPGKRMRPLMAYATGEALGIAPERVDPIAVAVELIHAYSLVHDDLPSMDDDDLRRGRPTAHVAYDEATAILVGDALQVLAFQVLAQAHIGVGGIDGFLWHGWWAGHGYCRGGQLADCREFGKDVFP